MEVGLYQSIYDCVGAFSGAGDEGERRGDCNGYCGVCGGVGGVCAGAAGDLFGWGVYSRGSGWDVRVKVFLLVFGGWGYRMLFCWAVRVYIM